MKLFSKKEYLINSIIFFSIISLITLYKCLLGFKADLFFEPGDPLAWKNLAIQIYEKGVFQEPFPKDQPFRSWRTPGYAFYLSILKYLNILNFFFVFFMNILFLTAGFLLAYLISKNFIKNKNIIYIIIIYCVITHIGTLSAIAQKNMNECLYFFMISGSIYLILSKNNWLNTIGFFILGLSVLVRSTILPLMFLLFIFLVIISLYLKKNLIKIKYTLILIPLILWLIRNYLIFNEFGFFIGSNSDHLLLGTFKEVDWNFIDNVYNNVHNKIKSFEILRSELRMKLAISRILENPFQYIIIKLDVIIRHLFDHFAIIPLTLLFSKILFLNKKLLFLKTNKIILILTILSILFLLINSITIYNPRYGVIASFYLSLFSIITYLKMKKL